jgi:hypothetical protein
VFSELSFTEIDSNDKKRLEAALRSWRQPRNYRPFLVRESNLARIRPTFSHALCVQSSRTDLERNKPMQAQRMVRPLNTTAKDQLLEALLRRAARFQKAVALRRLNVESRSTAGQSATS